MEQWYEALFQNFGLKYDNESFTKGTSGECDFLESEIGFNHQLTTTDFEMLIIAEK